MNDAWCTPRWLTDLIPTVDLDPCSNPNSTVRATRALSLENGDDGLANPWTEASVFCNPPYSRGQVIRWVRHGVQLVQANPHSWVLFLVKLDPTTGWWRQAHLVPCRAYPFRKRIRFAGAPATADFPSALLLMTQDTKHELPTKLKRALFGCLEAYPWAPSSV